MELGIGAVSHLKPKKKKGAITDGRSDGARRGQKSGYSQRTEVLTGGRCEVMGRVRAEQKREHHEAGIRASQAESREGRTSASHTARGPLGEIVIVE